MNVYRPTIPISLHEEVSLNIYLIVLKLNFDPKFLAVCQMLRNGLAAVLGPSSSSTSSHIQSICDALEIPHVNTGCQSRLRRTHYAINLHPHPTALGQAYVDVIRTWEWTAFTILYEEEEAMVRLQHLLKVSTTSGYKINVRKLPQTDNYR